jgi:hypothetical protein
VLRKVVNFAASKYKSTFRSASFALKYDSLRSERIVRAHAEITRLAGLRDTLILPGAVGIVNNIIHDSTCCLIPNYEDLWFFVVDRFGQDYLLILLIVSKNVTRLRRSWKIDTGKESQPSFGGRSGFTL